MNDWCFRPRFEDVFELPGEEVIVLRDVLEVIQGGVQAVARVPRARGSHSLLEGINN